MSAWLLSQPRRTATVWVSATNKTTSEKSKDELLWPRSHRRASVGRPAGTYQQLCSDIGCNLEDLPKGMGDIDECQKRVR